MALTQKIINPTNYFQVGDRVFLDVPDTSSQRFANAKIQGYETRLYYEYKDTLNKGGFGTFITLTYNNKNVPDVFGVPCFDYEDLRYLLNGAFYKKIKELGYNFKYFVSCELGEGKGKRGIYNNPHYHCAFFFTPNFSRSEYKKVDFSTGSFSDNVNLVRVNRHILTPEYVLYMVKHYWQGFTDNVPLKEYVNARYGIVKEGKFGVRITGLSGLRYICKYVFKHDSEYYLENKVRNIIWQNEFKRCFYNEKTFSDFMAIQGTDVFSVPNFDDIDFKCSDLNVLYSEYVSDIIRPYVDKEVRKFRNRHSGKVRISHGVGLSGLDAVDKHSLTISFPDSNRTFVKRPINLFYYRKLFYDTTKDLNNNTRYVLSDEGAALKVSLLDKKIDKANNHIFSALQYYRDFQKEFDYQYPELLNVPNDIVKLYNIYTYVYKYRFYPVNESDLPLDYHSDFYEFNLPSVLPSSFGEKVCYGYATHLPEGFEFYDTHPYFKDYRILFDSINFIVDYLDTKADEKSKELFKYYKELRQNHTLLNL